MFSFSLQYPSYLSAVSGMFTVAEEINKDLKKAMNATSVYSTGVIYIMPFNWHGLTKLNTTFIWDREALFSYA